MASTPKTRKPKQQALAGVLPETQAMFPSWPYENPDEQTYNATRKPSQWELELLEQEPEETA